MSLSDEIQKEFEKKIKPVIQPKTPAKITTIEAVEYEIIGTSVTIANDKTWAKLIVYTDKKHGIPQGRLKIDGTPKQLRWIARAILNGLKTERK